MALDFPNSPAAGTVFGAWRFDGTKWGAVSGVSGGGSAGDITAVLAGTGLSGGGTEGDVSIALAVPVTVARGGTGATDAATARTNLGAAPLAAPVFTGDPQAPTPARGDNDTSIATTEFVATAIAQAANQTYYYDLTDNSDIATYKKLLLAPSLNAESNTAQVCTGTSDVLMASFATDSGVPGAINYPAGSAYRRLYGKVSGGSAKFRLQILSRAPGGAETIVRDEYSPVFSSTTPALVEWLATPLGGTILPTDRLVAKVYGQRQTGSPTNVTVTLYCEGTNNASQMQTTIPMGSQALVGVNPPLTMNGGTISLTNPLPIANGGTGAATAAAAPWVEVAGDQMTGRLTVRYSDDAQMQALIAGSTRGARFSTNATGAYIEGVDQTGTASFQPLIIGGSQVSFTISGTEVGRFSAYKLFVVSPSGQPTGVELTVTGTRGWTVGVNAAGPLQITDTTAAAVRIQVNTDGACWNQTGTWNALSDARLKRAVRDYGRGLDAVRALRPVSFEFTGEGGTVADGKRHFGLLAQEVQPHLPELVSEQNGWLGVDYGRLVFACLNAIRELAAEIDELKAAR